MQPTIKQKTDNNGPTTKFTFEKKTISLISLLSFGNNT